MDFLPDEGEGAEPVASDQGVSSSAVDSSCRHALKGKETPGELFSELAGNGRFGKAVKESRTSGEEGTWSRISVPGQCRNTGWVGRCIRQDRIGAG